MSVYRPGFNLITTILIRIQNLPYIIDNVISRHDFKRKKLMYEDIIKIEYQCVDTPEFIFENMCIDKKMEEPENFEKTIHVLKENKVLKWKKNYVANFEYYDGCHWQVFITFKNNEVFKSSGDITFPKNFPLVYREFEKYIIVFEDED